jgi:hypothetical protein
VGWWKWRRRGGRVRVLKKILFEDTLLINIIVYNWGSWMYIIHN